MASSSRPECAIGIDVGGTKIASGLVAWPSGEVLARQIIPTQAKRPGQAILSDLEGLARGLLAKAASGGAETVGIGIGIAELVDLDGNITTAHTIPLVGIPVRATLARLAPCIVESDVRAAALGEARFGAGKAFDLFLYISVGTGISHCLVQSGKPFAGARGNALISGSSALTTQCTTCGTVLEPVLEDVASGPALVRRYHRIRPGQAARGEDVVAAAALGDPAAIEVLESAGTALGTVVGFLINVLDPEAVIVGGGLGLAGGIYWQHFVAATRRHIWADAARDLPILPAALGADAGIIGAAAAVARK